MRNGKWEVKMGKGGGEEQELGKEDCKLGWE